MKAIIFLQPAFKPALNNYVMKSFYRNPIQLRISSQEIGQWNWTPSSAWPMSKCDLMFNTHATLYPSHKVNFSKKTSIISKICGKIISLSFHFRCDL